MTERARKRAYGLAEQAIAAKWSYFASNYADEPDTLEALRDLGAGLRRASEVPLSPSGEEEQPTPFLEQVPACDECGAPLNAEGPCTADPAHRQDGDGYLFSDGADAFSHLMASVVADLLRGPVGVVNADEVDGRFREMVAAGELDPAELREAFDRRFPPKAAPQPLVTHEVRPEASRLEREGAVQRVCAPACSGATRPLPEGRGPAAEEGPPPAASSDPRTDVTALGFCDVVVAWVLNGLPSTAVAAGEVQRYRDHLLECASCAENVRMRVALEEAREAPDGRP